MYDKSYLESLIANKVEEDTHLDYKASAALYKPRGDDLYKEITKDISSFANSDGGILIYGIVEDREHRHLPGKIDAVDRTRVPREWLEQVIQNKISPRLEVDIQPVIVTDDPNEVVYVIVIPKGSTAYQASDKRYYKRSNSISMPMDDYEVKDVINRVKHPKIELEFEVHKYQLPNETFTYHLRVFATNISTIYAKYVNCYITIPEQCFAAKHSFDNTNKEQFFGENTVMDILERRALKPSGPIRHNPILPRRKMLMNVKLPMLDAKYAAYPHAIEWVVYADNAEPNRGSITFIIVPIVWG